MFNKIEILAHPSADAKVEDFISLANVFAVTNDIIDKTIEIRKSGRTKLPDALIAATALINGLELLTRNVSDFKNVQGLKVINPWEL